MTQGFDIKLATDYSIEEAVIIDVLFWWILKNACNDDMIKDGKVWCYCSSKGFERYIPYMGWQKIRRILKKVEEDEILVTGNYNKRPTDQTLWYAFSDKGIEILEGYGYDFSKMKNGIFKNEKSNINNINLINNNKYNKKEEKERLLFTAYCEKLNATIGMYLRRGTWFTYEVIQSITTPVEHEREFLVIRRLNDGVKSHYFHLTTEKSLKQTHYHRLDVMLKDILELTEIDVKRELVMGRVFCDNMFTGDIFNEIWQSFSMAKIRELL